MLKVFQRKAAEARDQREARQALAALCDNAYQVLCLILRSIDKALCSPEAYEELAFWAHRRELIEHYLDILSSNDAEAKIQILNEKLAGELCS